MTEFFQHRNVYLSAVIFVGVSICSCGLFRQIYPSSRDLVGTYALYDSLHNEIENLILFRPGEEFDSAIHKHIRVTDEPDAIGNFILFRYSGKMGVQSRGGIYICYYRPQGYPQKDVEYSHIELYDRGETFFGTQGHLLAGLAVYDAYRNVELRLKVHPDSVTLIYHSIKKY